MHRWRLFCISGFAALYLLASPPAAQAATTSHIQLSQADRGHAKNAFYFADRENWFEAIAHASRAKNPILRDYLTWRAMLTADNNFDFAAYHSFLQRHPNWPSQSRLVLRAEDRLFSGDASKASTSQLKQWFAAHPPISGKGMLVQADYLQKNGGNTAQITKLIRNAWVQGDFDSTQEKMIMLRHSKTLRQQDYIERIDRQIWESKYNAAERMFFAVPDSYQQLFKSRILLARNKPGVNTAIARTPAGLRNDPGLIYERMKWRYRKGMEKGVEELLIAAPATVPYPDKWWRTRHIQVREALEKGRPAHALKLLKNHGQVDGIGQAEALWLQGWITLEFMEKPREAYDYFAALEKAVSYPVSKSRAQYWLGRSADALGQAELAKKWYSIGAVHNTTFYGQLAAVKIHKNARLQLPITSRPTQAQLNAFLADSRVKVVYMLAETGQLDNAPTFIRHLMDEATTHSQALLTAELGGAVKRQDFAVQASKDAMKHHIVLPQTSYPFYRLTFRAPIEEPFVWAITRQESLFHPSIQSHAGAKGLMQLMPSTAREVARKNNMPYHPNRLENPIYNLHLGSSYLASMVKRFDGSYILAIASYNAGPGRIRGWIEEFGEPGNTPEEAIDWIERIPYSETRNYVQRVLENLQVYRAIISPKNGQYIQLEKDLVR